jgi:hypothetical protein
MRLAAFCSNERKRSQHKGATTGSDVNCQKGAHPPRIVHLLPPMTRRRRDHNVSLRAP